MKMITGRSCTLMHSFVTDYNRGFLDLNGLRGLDCVDWIAQIGFSGLDFMD